jgi:predicted nuclease of predicted toxin-antitoxin system
MPARIRFHLDEHVAAAIAGGLRARGVDVTTSADADLLGVDDRTQLAFARSENRVLVTHDADFLSIVSEGLGHAGICYCRQQSRSVRQMIEMLFLLHECFEAEDMQDRVEFL